MKNLLKTTLLLTVLSFAVVTAKAQTGKIVFEKTSHSFGNNIPEKGGDVTCRFVFTNTGNAPVTVTNVQTSCGCTTPGWSKEPVAPGGQGYVDATYRPNGRPGAFSKNLTVTNSGDPKQISLSISGVVIKAPLSLEEEFPIALEEIRLTGKAFALARVVIDTKEEKANIVKVYNSSNAPINVSLKNIPDYLKADIQPVSLEPKQKGEIKVSYLAAKKIKYGTSIDELELLVNGKKAGSLTASITIIPVATTPKKDGPVMKFINNNYTFSNIKQGSMVTQDFEFINEGKIDLQIIDINVVNKKENNLEITVSPEIIKPGEKGIVKVVLSTKELEGPQDFNIELITNVATNPISNIMLRGNILK